MPRAATRTSTRKPRATVTRAFLFSDLRGYTDFVETRGDSRAAALLKEYRSLIRREVARHQGAEVKTEGDSFYVVFESPMAALECAIAIQRRAAEHNVKVPTAALRIGMGIHVGETVPFDDQFVGGAVNVGARLASKAKAGELLISDTLRGLVRTSQQYRMEDRGPLRLKGVAERLRAWSVDWSSVAVPSSGAPTEAVPSVTLPLIPETRSTGPIAAPAAGQLVCPVVVGRDEELARLVAHLDRARAGQGQTVLLAGEAGVGKSAFVRSAAESASARGFRVLYGVTLESDGGLPYAPFVAAVRSGFRGIERDRLGKVLAQTAPDLAQLFPELGRSAASEASSAIEQRRLSVAFQGLFGTFARETPVLLVLEDLHWCDEASLTLLHYLARELRDQPILVLGTYRSDEMHRKHPLLRVLAGMQRERLIGEITLGRLNKEQVRRLIHETFLRTDPNIRITDEFRDAIYARSEGNPFFTEELLKSLVDSGDLSFKPESGWERTKPIDQLRIPGSVREAVRERIDRLSEEAQSSVTAAAAIGLRFPFELLLRVREISEGALEAHLREAIEQQLFVEIGGEADDYGFRHALTKEVVYEDLMVRERKRLHRRVADALEADPGTEPALLAHHFIAAGDNDAAIPHLLRAAEHSYRAYAPREAAAHYERAIEIGLDDNRLAQVLESLADAYYLFDFALARKAAEEAATAYREQADARGLSRMLRLASRSTWQLGDPNKATVLGKEALGTLEGLPESLELGRALVNLATLRMLARADEEAIALSDRAEALGRQFHDAWTVANALVTKGTSLTREDQTAGRRVIEQGRQHAIEHGLAEVAVRAWNNLLVGPGLDATERDRILDEGAEYARQHGVEHPMFMASRVFRSWLRGAWDDAIAYAERVPSGSYWRRGLTDGALAWIALGREGPDAAIALSAERAREAAESEEAQSFTGAVAVMAYFHAHKGDRPGTEEWLARIRERIASDRGPLRQAAAGLAFVVIMPAVVCDQRDWPDLIEAERPKDELLWRTGSHAVAAARAIFAKDGLGCAAAIQAQYEFLTAEGWGPIPSLLIVAADELRRRGVTLSPEWRAPLAAARAFTERARAPWYARKLDEIEREIGAP